MRHLILGFLLTFSSHLLSLNPENCGQALNKLGNEKPVTHRKLYFPLLSTNATALRDAKINTTFPSPNMFAPAPEKWLAPDSEYKAQIAARKGLYQKRPGDILKIQPGEEQRVKEAAQEFFEMTAAHLVKHFPNQFVIENNAIRSIETGESFSLDPNQGPHPLEKVGLLIQDDITVNVKNPEGKVILAGGFLSTPTNWSLQDFLGLDVDAIHANVPGYKEKLKKTVEGSVERGVPGKCIARNNWFLSTNPELAIPSYRRSTYKRTPITENNVGKNLFLRSELESIMNLPKTGGTIFTIRPRVWDMEFVKAQAPEQAKKLAEAISNPESGYANEDWKAPLLKYLSGFN